MHSAAYINTTETQAGISPLILSFGKVPLANFYYLCHWPASGFSALLEKFLVLSFCLNPTVILRVEGNNEQENKEKG